MIKINNENGVAHLFPIIIVMLLCLIAFSVFTPINNSKTDNSHVSGVDSQVDQNSSEFVRKTAYAMIDVQGQVMKLQVDLALRAWDSMSEEQKRQVGDYVLKGVKIGMSQSRQMLEEMKNNASARDYKFDIGGENAHH